MADMTRLPALLLLSLVQSAIGVEGPLPKPTSPPGLEVVLRTAESKTTFHLSEIVPLAVVFRAAKPATYSIEIADGWNRALAADRFLAEPSREVVDRRRWLHGIACCDSRRPSIPTVSTVDEHELTNFLRFTRPGEYRIQYTTRRVFNRSAAPTYEPGTLLIRSNALTLRVSEDEPVWLQRTLQTSLPEGNGDGYQGIDNSVAFSSRPDLVAEALRERASAPGFGVTRGYFELWVGVLMERDFPEAYRLPRQGKARDPGVAAEITGTTVRSVERQAAAPVVLSGPLRMHLRDERFGIVTSIRGLPLGVRNELETLFGSQALDIAEPGDEFQVTDAIVDPKLPIRRLVAAGCSIDHCIVYYERGGRTHTWRMALFHWTPDATRFEWGGVAPRGLASIDDVRNAMLSGAIKGPTKLW